MNSKKENAILVAVAGAALWAAFVLIKPQFSIVPDSLNESSSPVQMVPKSSTSSHQNSEGTAVSQQPPTIATNKAPLAPRLQEIGQCLEINISPNEAPKPTFSDLQSSLQSAFGDLMGETSDWKIAHIILPNGEKRRLRIEVEAVGEEGIRRQLQYYSVDAEDLPVPIPLPADQGTNPTDTFIASLEGQGQITLREEAHRGFYSQGAEMYYVERNGTLFELEMSYNGKSVRCQDLDKSQGSCRCF